MFSVWFDKKLRVFSIVSLIKARLHGNDLSNIVILRAQRDKSVLGVICVFFELIGNFQNVNGNFQKKVGNFQDE
jgi:hypothetical protein